eukprot:CAMPEP_0185758794 /NCGR_PEP_ID=MMETSP1174-20130828/17468_1 /TAXON_ID=35687 /ORGANISM="Dictyocha speculum, Strain CCMP1381" /LENGTH=277 /DNA_ID=CAMNT_0028438811 /DNA_START=15 /DNA_END=848 /DNA_ORIENTATION=-
MKRRSSDDRRPRNESADDRRPRNETARNKWALDSSSSALGVPTNGSRFFCRLCRFSTGGFKTKRDDIVVNGIIYCCHRVKKLPDSYRDPAHFRANKFSFYKHHPICPQFVHVLRDEDASGIFLKYLELNGLPRPKNRQEMIAIFKALRNPYDHPLNSSGDFEATGRCMHLDHFRTACPRYALINGIQFCFDHMPASIMLKVLPPPKLQGTADEKDLTKFVFWMQSQGGTDKEWSTPWKYKATKDKEKILKNSAQRLKVSLVNMHVLTGNEKKFTWLQ